MTLQNPIFFYANLLKSYTPTVTSEASGYPKGNLYDDDLNSMWKATSTAEQSINIDAGAAVPVDVFCLGPVHNLKTADAELSLQYSSTGAWAGEQTVVFTLTPSADNVYDHRLFTQVSARYWRIVLASLAATPQIGEIAFGARYTLPKYFAEGFDDRNRVLTKTVNTSDGGQREKIVFHRRRTFPCTMTPITVGAQAETDFFTWRDAVEDGTPFWFLYDVGNDYETVFVSLIDTEFNAPISLGLSRQNITFKLEEEL